MLTIIIIYYGYNKKLLLLKLLLKRKKIPCKLIIFHLIYLIYFYTKYIV